MPRGLVSQFALRVQSALDSAEHWSVWSCIMSASAEERIDEHQSGSENGLSLSCLSLTTLPARVASLNTLESLDVSKNSLSELPACIGSLTALINLDASRNQLTRIAGCVSMRLAQAARRHMRLLCCVVLHRPVPRTQAMTSPQCREIGALKNLKFINVMCNKLTVLPDEICNLTSLYRLGAKSNFLQELPENFGALINLVELFLTDNCLKTFPDSLQHCTALVKLQVLTTHDTVGST